MANKVRIDLEAVDKSKAAFDSVKKNMDGAATKAKETSSVFSKVWESGFGRFATVAGAATAAIGIFKVGILGSIQAASSHEDALRKLQTAIELAGGTWEKEKDKVDDFTNAMQKQSRFSNTEMVKSMQMIVQLTGDTAKGYEGARIAADIAATGLFDLTTASRYVAMAMDGEITMLGRYIPAFKQAALEQAGVKTQAEKVAYAMEILNEKFGGAAQKDIYSYGGASKQLRDAFGDLQREIGEHLLPHLTHLTQQLIPMIANLAESIDKLEAYRVSVEAAWKTMHPLDEGIRKAIENLTMLDPVVQNAVNRIWAKKEATEESTIADGEAAAVITDELVPAVDLLSDSLEENWRTIEKASHWYDKYMGNISTRTPKAAQDISMGFNRAFSFIQRSWSGFTHAYFTGISLITNETMTGSQKWQAIWKSFVDGILQELARIVARLLIIEAMKRAIIGPLGGILPFKEGGEVGYQFGGTVYGRYGADKVPAMLTAGEFVVNRTAAQTFFPLLQAINSLKLQAGGPVTYDNSRSISIHVGDNTAMGARDLVDILIPELEKAIAHRRLIVS